MLELWDHIHRLTYRLWTYYAHLLFPYIFYLLTQDLDGNGAHETGKVNLLSECQGMVIQLNGSKCHWSCEFMLSIRITIMTHKPATRCRFYKIKNDMVPGRMQRPTLIVVCWEANWTYESCDILLSEEVYALAWAQLDCKNSDHSPLEKPGPTSRSIETRTRSRVEFEVEKDDPTYASL